MVSPGSTWAPERGSLVFSTVQVPSLALVTVQVTSAPEVIVTESVLLICWPAASTQLHPTWV
jgi:hypothetical protein